MSVEFVGIELQLRGADAVQNDLKEIDRLINSIGGRKAVKSGLADLERDAVATRGEIEKLERAYKSLNDAVKSGAIAEESVADALEDTSSRLQEAKYHLDDVKQASREVRTEFKNAGKTFQEVSRSIASSVAQFGGRMTTLGKTIGKITSPISSLMRSTIFAAGFKALDLFTQGFANSFERADTMKNYDRTLKALGLDVAQTFSIAGKEAKTAKENLDDAVQGLPTSLDEIMSAQKIYAGATGEMVESTKTAIAANNTVLASGMGSREQRFMQKYLVALASGAELTTTQWQSMARIAPLAMRAVSKELGYASDEYAQFNKDVQQGTIAGKDFLKAFQEVGISGAVANAARAQTESWSGLFSNIRIAVTRLGANVIDTLNETFKDATGRTLLQQLLGWDAEGKDLGDGIKHWINGISESIQNWIKEHPQEIIDFFNELKSIDVKGLLQGIAQGLGDMVGIIRAIAKGVSQVFGDKGLSGLGRFYAWLWPISKLLTVGGGLLKGSSPFIGKVGALLTTKAGKGGGLFAKIASLFGKKKDLASAGEAAKKIPTLSNTFKSAIGSLEGLIKASGAILLVSGTGFVVFKAVKSIIKDMNEILEIIREGNWENVGYVGAGIIVGIGVFTEIFNAIGAALGSGGLLNVGIAALASIFVTGAIDADLALIKDGVKNIRDTIYGIDEVASAIENMTGFTNLEDGKKKLKNAVTAMLDIAEIFEGENGSVKNRGVVTKGLPSFSAGTVRSIQNLATGIESLRNVAVQFNSLNTITINTGVKQKVRDIMDAINTVTTELKSLTFFISGPKNLKTNANRLADAMIELRRVAYHINKMADTSISTEGFSSFLDQIKIALDDLKNIGEVELDITLKLSAAFDRSTTAVVRKIVRAKDKIKQALDAIPNHMTKNISISITATVNTAGAINSINRGVSAVSRIASGAVPQQMGGLVYRARGGSIPFKRRGTDTVPAMLTPGEFVHNKKAVNTFGIEFMRRVNSLDMKGAMNELMARAGHMANVNRNTTVNNTYNNNQKVVQHINTSNPDFAFRSASRFVGAF